MNELSAADIQTLQEIFGSSSDEEDHDDVNARDLTSNSGLRRNTSSVLMESSNSKADAEGDLEQWHSFLSGFGAQRACIDKFFSWRASYDTVNTSLHMSLLKYFDFQREQLNNDNQRMYAPTTMRGWLAIFSRYWAFTGRGDLKMLCPLLETNLSKWEKTYKVKKAYTFEKEHLGKQ